MRVSGILLITLIFFTTGCSLFNSDEEISDKLVGTWEYEVAVNTEQAIKVIRNYHFLDINTYEIIEEHYDLQDNFLGYRLFRDGSYSLKENNLVMKDDQAFRSENAVLYPTIEELKAAGVEEQGLDKEEYRTEFSNSNTTVTLFFDCPFNASCIAPPVLDKVIESGPVVF
jgi:hypothetical protein